MLLSKVSIFAKSRIVEKIHKAVKAEHAIWCSHTLVNMIEFCLELLRPFCVFRGAFKSKEDHLCLMLPIIPESLVRLTICRELLAPSEEAPIPFIFKSRSEAVLSTQS